MWANTEGPRVFLRKIVKSVCRISFSRLLIAMYSWMYGQLSLEYFTLQKIKKWSNSQASSAVIRSFLFYDFWVDSWMFIWRWSGSVRTTESKNMWTVSMWLDWTQSRRDWWPKMWQTIIIMTMWHLLGSVWNKDSITTTSDWQHTLKDLKTEPTV